MMIKRASIFLLLAQLAMMALPPVAVAQVSKEVKEFDALHHSANAYYLDIAPFHPFELPRIFVVQHKDGSYGLDLFRSTTSAILNGHYTVDHSAGEHGPAKDESHEVATDGGATAEEHAASSGIEVTLEDIEGQLLAAEGSHIVLDLSISRHLFFAWLSMALLLFFMTRLAGMYKRGIGRDSAPKGLFQNFFETIIMFVRDEIARPNLGAKTDKYLPYLLTAFFFILTSNFIGLVPFGATATSNLMVTGVLAFFTFVITQLGGTKDYWGHIFWPPGVPAFIRPILIPVEIMGIFTKPIALAIRLFANMTAGHLVILSLIGFIFSFAQMFGPGAGYGVAPVSVAFALFVYLLELLVSLIQAYVFTMLSALFISMAIQEHDHGHDHAHSVGHVSDHSETVSA
jgi:F-type H+-transporting ATPase subunit a